MWVSYLCLNTLHVTQEAKQAVYLILWNLWEIPRDELGWFMKAQWLKEHVRGWVFKLEDQVTHILSWALRNTFCFVFYVLLWCKTSTVFPQKSSLNHCMEWIACCKRITKEGEEKVHRLVLWCGILSSFLPLHSQVLLHLKKMVSFQVQLEKNKALSINESLRCLSGCAKSICYG